MPRKLTVTAALIVGLAVCILVALARPASRTSADPQLDSEEQAFVTLINNYRAQNGLGPLSIDWEMQASSDWMSADMGQKGYFSHTDSLGRDPWTRMCDFGYCYNTWKGENIAAGYTTAQSVFTAWQNSPGHNANMLGANYTAMGISRVNTPGSVYGWYWTNDFGGVNSNATPPASATPATSPTLTPSPTASPTNSPSPTPSPTYTPSPTPSPTHTPSPSPTRTPTATPTPTPTPSPTASPTASPTPGPTSGVCPAVSGAGHPVLIGPLIISAPSFYNGDGQTVIGGANNIDIEASNVTVCNYTLQGAQGASVNIGYNGSFNHVTLGALNIQDYNQSGAGGVIPGGPQYVGGVACWYCTGLTVVDSTIASTKDYGNGIWVKRTNAAEAGPDYFARNTIIGGWDGIGSEPEGDVDGGIGSGTIIENNLVSGCHDDGIQVEGRDENITVRNNTITGCGTGVATAAALVGPVHIENNYIHDLAYAPSTAFFCFKLGASQGATPVEIDYTGNTCLGGSGVDPNGDGPGGFKQTNSGLNFKIVATHNCIQDGLYVIDFNEPPGPGTSFDYNTLYTSDATGRFAKWGGVRYDLAGLRGLGQELHGVEAQGCPGATQTPAPSPTHTPTSSPTHTPTPSPTHTSTSSPSPSFAPTPTPTLTPTVTASPTTSPLSSSTPTPTPGPILPPPPAPTNTPPPTPDGQTPTPSSTGEAASTATATPAVTFAPVKGDADCNGQINAQDVIRLLEDVGQMGRLGSSGCTPDLDVNCDGRVDAMDALAVLLGLAGQPAHLANGCASPSA